MDIIVHIAALINCAAFIVSTAINVEKWIRERSEKDANSEKEES